MCKLCSFYIFANLFLQILQSLLFTLPAKTLFLHTLKNYFLHTMQKLLFSYPAKTSFYMTCNTYFLCFCKPHFTYSAIPSFLHILRKPPFKFLTTDAAEMYVSCKYERHSHFAQYVNLRMWPKLSAVHQNPTWVELRLG